MIEDAWQEYEEQLRSLGAGPVAAALTLLWDTRFSLVTIVLAGFGRAAAEVGAAMIVGGNIDGVTRVMTTAIALETSKGDLPLALALGIILLALVLMLNAAAYIIKEAAQRRYGSGRTQKVRATSRPSVKLERARVMSINGLCALVIAASRPRYLNQIFSGKLHGIRPADF